MKYICASLLPFLFGFNPPVISQGLPTATPEEVGISSKRLERINTLMQHYVDEKKLAGAVTLVARRGKIVHFERFGMMDIEANQPMQLDTIFRIYSMTKPITSVAVMMLYEEGRFQLNDPISKFIPELKGLKVVKNVTASGIELVEAEREITIRDLLIHTSGFPYGFGDGPVDQMYQKAKLLAPDSTLKEMVQKLGVIPLVHQPGTKWEYSVSTDVLGYLVEVVSGKPLDLFFEENIFKPLGMKDTGFYVPKEKIARFAANYGPDETGRIKVIDEPKTSPFSSPRRFLSGGGGLVSTVSDYLRFAQMLLDGGELNGARLLGRKTIELMTTNNLPNELIPIQLGGTPLEGYGFGLGFSVLVDVARSQELGSEGSFGWAGAATTLFLIAPKEELIAIAMTQFMPYDHYPVFKEFRVLTYQAIVD